MCKQCKTYDDIGKKLILTAPITPTEIYVWNKYGVGWFHFWHRYAKWDWNAKDKNGLPKMA